MMDFMDEVHGRRSISHREFMVVEFASDGLRALLGNMVAALGVWFLDRRPNR